MRAAVAQGVRRLGSFGFDEPRTMAVALAVLFLAGAAIGSLSLLLPHPEEFDTPALWTNVALAVVGGLGLVALRNRLPLWAIHLGVLAGTIVVTRAVYLSDHPDGFYAFWYLWVGVYAFFFFGRSLGGVHLLAIAFAYAWVLETVETATPATSWVVAISCIAVVGLLVDVLARRLRGVTIAAASRAANLEAVYEVAHQLATQSDPRAVGWAICTAALRAIGGSASVLWRPSSSGSELVASASAGAELERLRVPFVSPDSGAVQAFTSAEPRFEQVEAGGPLHELAPKFAAEAALWQPVMSDSTVVGVLAIYWRQPRDELVPEQRQAVELLALEAAIAIERGELLGRLEEAARTDDLTGLFNRRAWSAELGRELARADRQALPLCVAVLDLDRFKEFNDEHGHQAGDRFLKQVSGVWSGLLRTTDILARHGGEEFALAMPATPPENAERLVERLRVAMPDGQTCSAGVCVWDGDESAEALLSRADTALYRAKGSGRDRVVAG